MCRIEYVADDGKRFGTEDECKAYMAIPCIYEVTRVKSTYDPYTCYPMSVGVFLTHEEALKVKALLKFPTTIERKMIQYAQQTPEPERDSMYTTFIKKFKDAYGIVY